MTPEAAKNLMSCSENLFLKQALLWSAGGGVTQIVMPYMTEGIAKHVPEYEAWRWAFFLPGCLYIVITFLILTLGQVHQPFACLHCFMYSIT